MSSSGKSRDLSTNLSYRGLGSDPVIDLPVEGARVIYICLENDVTIGLVELPMEN